MSQPRILAVQLAGTTVIAVVSLALAWALRRGARLLRRGDADAAAIAVSTLFVVAGFGHAGWTLRSPLTVLPVPRAAIGALTIVAFGVAGWLLGKFLRRRAVSQTEITLVAASVVALFILATVVSNANVVGQPTPAGPFVRRALGAIYLAATATAVLRVPSRRRLAALVAIPLLALLAVRTGTTNRHAVHVVSPAPSTPAAGPSVIFVVLDTFRADAIDYSSPPRSETPEIARFAAGADVYTHAVANASWTLPGHASLFTGRFLHEHRTDASLLPGFRPGVSEEHEMLQEIFGRRGYRTSAVVSNPVISRHTGLPRGFQRFHQPSRFWLTRTLPLKLATALVPGELMIAQLLAELSGVERDAPAGEIVDGALREIELADGAPYYLFLNFMDVHMPNPAPAELPWRDRLPMLKGELAALVGLVDTTDLFRERIETVRLYYRASVDAIDVELGRLFAELQRRGEWDDLLIVVTADHGEAFYENTETPQYYGHHSSWEPAVRIPLIVKYPGQTAGRRLDDLVQQVDVAPTVLRTAGLPTPPDLAGGLDRERTIPVLTEWYPRAHPWGLPHPRIGIYRDRFKLVLGEDGEAELFDLDRFPYEEHDSLAEHEAIGDTLRAELTEQLANATPTDSGEGEIDDALRDRLRALGYIQ